MFKNILIPIDVEDENSWHKALPAAVELAGQHGASLHILTVVPGFGMSLVGSFFPEGYEQKATAMVKERLESFVAGHVGELKPSIEVAHGKPYEQILTTAQRIGADLIVVAAHRPELSEYLLGPNAARVVRHAGCSVLVIRE